jgi:hypothetical protein
MSEYRSEQFDLVPGARACEGRSLQREARQRRSMAGISSLRRLSWRFKLTCGLGLVVPGLLARSLDGHAAGAVQERPVTMGLRYRVTVIAARVDFECSGCGPPKKSTDRPLPDEIEVQVRFLPNGEASPDTFLFSSGHEFIPPVDGRLELADGTLSSAAISKLEDAYRNQCSGLDITDVALKELRLEPPQGEP